MWFFNIVRSMKKIFILLLSVSIIILFSSCSEKSNKIAETDLHFFYLELCPSCEEYVMAEELAASVLTLGGKALNIIHDDDAKKMKEILTEKNLADISHVLPLLVIKDTYAVGYEEISDKIDELKNNQ